MSKNGGEILAERLAAYGVKFVFGVPGGQTLSFYDGIGKLQPKIRHVLVRDEKSSVFMAIGYSKVTFRPGVADGTAGPGAANMLPSVIEAYAGSCPVLILTSNIVTKWMGRGASQELDHFKLFDSFVKASIRPRNAHDMKDVIRKAFNLATSGRPGPVHIDLPQDILEDVDQNPDDVESLEVLSHFPSYRVGPDPNELASAVHLINECAGPVIFAGGGSMMSQAFDEVKELSELIQAPVVTTLSAKGIIPEDHPLSIGCVGRQGYRPSANKILKEADLIIALGTKFAQVATNNWTLIDQNKVKIIHIDIDPAELNKNYVDTVAIASDVKFALRGIISSLNQLKGKDRNEVRPEWSSRIKKIKEEWNSIWERESSDSSPPIKPAFVLKEIQKSLPEHSVLVSSGSFSGAFAGCFYQVLGKGNICRFIQGRGMAGTETALPLAIGAALGVQDDSKVLAITGDGGFGYHIAELETARRMGLALPIVILNNGSLAWMKIIQKEKFGERYFSTNYSSDLSYASVAESFGCKGVRVERSSELATAIKDAVKSDGVTVVEVMTDPLDCSSTHMAGDRLARYEGAQDY